ncbi:hypothetical protein O0L34_g1761 [Tuta absoluta]|nr:hypothetical protein O0L34_g1761 [Tuta absoluta]
MFINFSTGIRLGEYNKTNPGQDCVDLPSGKECTTAISIPIDKVLPHEHYVFNMTSIANDIALIRLKELAPYTDHIRAICLPSSDFTSNPAPNLKLHVAGWGVMKQVKTPGSSTGYKNIDSDVKQHVALPYMSFEECRTVQRLVTNTHICAGGNGQDSCMGDSGGPLMFNREGVHEAVGVVSYGPGAPCGVKGVPGVYTKVFSFKEWILKHVDSFKE